MNRRVSATARRLAAAFAAIMLTGTAHSQIVEPTPVPQGIAVSTAALTRERGALMTQHNSLLARLNAHNGRCSQVPSDDAEANQTCQASAAAVTADLSAYRTELASYEANVREHNEALRIISSMGALARRRGWSRSELRRLDNALRSFALAVNLSRDGARAAQVWTGMRARAADPNLAAAAAAGLGPGLYGSGQQSFEDCAVFALAAATGRPYSFVAALAAELIRAGEWRNASDRGNPQGAIENPGLFGAEIIMIAEALGRVEIVPPSMFSATLRGGSPVMITVRTAEGRRHEMVLSKVFQHNGAAWYEIINSGPEPRFYVSAVELGSILDQNGVTYRPSLGTTVTPLR